MRRCAGSKPETSPSPWKTRGNRRRERNRNGARILDGNCRRRVSWHFDSWTTLQEAGRPSHVTHVHPVHEFCRANSFRAAFRDVDRANTRMSSFRYGRHIPQRTHQTLTQRDDPLVAMPTADQHSGGDRRDNNHNHQSYETPRCPHSPGPCHFIAGFTRLQLAHALGTRRVVDVCDPTAMSSATVRRL